MKYTCYSCGNIQSIHDGSVCLAVGCGKPLWEALAEKIRAEDGPKRKSNNRPNGYAGVPGTGPGGETCKTCEFCAAVDYHDKRYYKCKKRLKWTHGLGTDILLKSPACQFWEKEKAKDEQEQK